MRVGSLPFFQIDPGVVVSLLLFRVPLPRLVGLAERALIGLLSRIDTPIEVDYFLHGGILPYVLRELMAA